jgi:hypothetical protein
MIKMIFFSMFILLAGVSSSCQEKNRLVNEVKVEARFQLGEKDFFEMSKDTASYLPDEIVYYPPFLYFAEKYSNNLIEFNTGTKKKRSLVTINAVLKQYHERTAKQIQQIEVRKDGIFIMFEDHFFIFNRLDFRLIRDFSVDPFACFFILTDMTYAAVSPSGDEITFYDSSGQRTRHFNLSVSCGGFLASFDSHYFISNTHETFSIDEDSLRLGKLSLVKIPFTIEEKGKYFLMAATDEVLLWADGTNINKVVVTSRANGYKPIVFDIDKKVIDDADITKFPLIDLPNADPPELRQYFRLASDGKSIFILFQSKGYMNLCSFEPSW